MAPTQVGLNDMSGRDSPARNLRISIVVTLAALTAQGWTGDSVNLFSQFPNSTVQHSFTDLWLALSTGGPIATLHGIEGLALVALSFLTLLLSFKSSKSKSVRITSVLATIAIVSAAIGGVLFVFSGFQDNGVSSQMGTSFIAAYALYFTELYYTKVSNLSRV